MKKRSFILATAAVIISSVTIFSCGKVKEAIKASVPVTMEQEFTIPVILSTDENNLGEMQVDANIDQLIKDNNSSLSAMNIRSVKLTSCIMTIEPPVDDKDNFTALESAKIELSSDTKAEWVTIATISNPTETSTLNAPVNTDLDLKDYFNATKFNYRISGKAKRVTTHEIKCKAVFKCKVEAGL